MIAPNENYGGRTFDTANHFEVVAKPGFVQVRKFPVDGKFTESEAANLGAWLVAMSGMNASELLRMLTEIANK